MSENEGLDQTSMSDASRIEIATHNLSVSGIEERGAIFTKEEVVSFILDLIQYTSDRPLYSQRLLEPSFGEGEFLFAVVKRLINSLPKGRRDKNVMTSLKHAIRAVELHNRSFEMTKTKLRGLLNQNGFSVYEAGELSDNWLINGDFLRTDFDQGFDYVIGNPPYVRQELIPEALLMAYRQRYKTMYDRADLYIPFIERSLELLADKGVLGFICADRWMKNKYGTKLRQFVSENFNLRIYVDMVNTPAFHSDVMAYPAITIIANEKPGQTRIARQPQISSEALTALAKQILSGDAIPGGAECTELVAGTQPWILDETEKLALVRRLERDYPVLEEAGCKIGIGVATGADAAFIGPYSELDVEPSRKLPLAMTRDFVDGEIKWRGLGVINPFEKSGGLVDLDQYPRLKKYLDTHKTLIKKRHVAQKSSANWYRTIDRIYPSLAKEPKLLIPDIKGEASIVFEEGKLYPHHNLYYVTSKDWNLKALQAVLKSGIASLFVSTYSTKMRGGYFRFQAQYLRRIRIPLWESVPKALKARLIRAGESNDKPASLEAVAELYQLNEKERKILSVTGSN